MPKWNLSDDWPEGPKNQNGFDIPLFSLPFSDAIDENAYSLKLDISTLDKKKKLVIGVAQQQSVDVLAITHGTINAGGNSLELYCDTFSVWWLNNMFLKLREVPQQSLAGFPVTWFKNWIEAGLIPRKITYENITGAKPGTATAGQKIGTSIINLADPENQTILLSIEYAESKTASAQGKPRFYASERAFQFALLAREVRSDLTRKSRAIWPSIIAQNDDNL